VVLSYANKHQRFIPFFRRARLGVASWSGEGIFRAEKFIVRPVVVEANCTTIMAVARSVGLIEASNEVLVDNDLRTVEEAEDGNLHEAAPLSAWAHAFGVLGHSYEALLVDPFSKCIGANLLPCLLHDTIHKLLPKFLRPLGTLSVS